MYQPDNISHYRTRKYMVDTCGYCSSVNLKNRSCIDCGTTAPNINPPDENRKKFRRYTSKNV